jgi:hypothetical protein
VLDGNCIGNAIPGPLRDERTATLDRLAIAIGRNGTKPNNLGGLPACSIKNGGGTAPTASGPVVLQAPSGPDNELPGDAGVIQRAASVKIEYRGSPTSASTTSRAAGTAGTPTAPTTARTSPSPLPRPAPAAWGSWPSRSRGSPC